MKHSYYTDEDTGDNTGLTDQEAAIINQYRAMQSQQYNQDYFPHPYFQAPAPIVKKAQPKRERVSFFHPVILFLAIVFTVLIYSGVQLWKGN